MLWKINLCEKCNGCFLLHANQHNGNRVYGSRCRCRSIKFHDTVRITLYARKCNVKQLPCICSIFKFKNLIKPKVNSLHLCVWFNELLSICFYEINVFFHATPSCFVFFRPDIREEAGIIQVRLLNVRCLWEFRLCLVDDFLCIFSYYDLPEHFSCVLISCFIFILTCLYPKCSSFWWIQKISFFLKHFTVLLKLYCSLERRKVIMEN